MVKKNQGACPVSNEKHQPFIVEGSKTGLKGSGEWCFQCQTETFNIPADRVSLCANCGSELFACSRCGERADENCTWERGTLRCNRFDHTDEWKMGERERNRMTLKARLGYLEETRKTATGSTLLRIDAEMAETREFIHELNQLIAEPICRAYHRCYGKA